MGSVCGLIFLLTLLSSLGQHRNSGADIGGSVIAGVVTAMFIAASVVLNRDSKKAPTEEPSDEPSLLDPLDSVYLAAIAHERPQHIRKWIIISFPFLIVGGCVGYNVIDTLQIVKEASEFKACINDLRQLDPAIQ